MLLLVFFPASHFFFAMPPSLSLALAALLCLASLAAQASCATTAPWKQGVTTAIRDGDVYTLQSLLAAASPNDLAIEFCMGLTPLQYAAKTNGASVDVLLAAGCDPTLAHVTTGTTPLMFASRSGDVVAVTALLAVLSRSDVDAIDEHGSTALGLCSLTCNAKVAELLISAGADIFKPDASGNTALHVGAFYCTEPLGAAFAQLLLSHDTVATLQSINVMSTYGRTALMLAVKQGHAGYADALVLAGADASLVSPYDQKTVQDFQLEYQASLRDL